MPGIRRKPEVIELAEGWPHKHLLENPYEIHIQPRTGYFVRDGKVVFVRLEELSSEDADRHIDLVSELQRVAR